MKSMILAVTFLLMMLYLPKKLFLVVYVLFLFGNIIRLLILYVKDEKVEHPWLAPSNYPEIVPVKEFKIYDNQTTNTAIFLFNMLETMTGYINLFWQIISLAILIYISMKGIRNPTYQMIAVMYSSLLMLPLTQVFVEKIRKQKDEENPVGIKGIYVGYIEGEITPKSLFFNKPSNTTYECLFAQILINGKTHNVLCDEEAIEELIINEEVYVYSSISNSMEILEIGGVDETKGDEALVKDVE